MASYNLAEAKAQLSDLVARAEAGEPIEIMRRGKAAVRLVPAIEPASQKKRIDIEMLRAVTATMPMQTEPAGDFVRRMRDTERY